MNEYDSYAGFYDLLYGKDQHDLAFYQSMAEQTGGPVCELACGTGRLTLPLARAGFEITGVDISRVMLEQLRAKLSAEPPAVRDRVTVIQADIREWRPDKRFRLVFCPVNSFLHLLTTDDQLRCLRAARDYLADDGRLVIDIFAPSYPRLASRTETVVDRQHDPENGRQMVMTDIAQRDWQHQLIEAHLYVDRIADDGTVRRQGADVSLCWIFNREMHLLFRLAGYEVEAVYGGHDRRPYDYVSGIQLFVARKVSR